MEIRGSRRTERGNRYSNRRSEREDSVYSVVDEEKRAFTIKGAYGITTPTHSRVRNDSEIKSEAATVKELQARIEKLEAEKNSPQRRTFKRGVTCFN
ncbi:hypothetical protein DPMN_072932 [Dreissena polymorpha]|uniref:Uncharacterized protein n=1 Tax=Dreissena polymorpha TaxID=45954 RepID=A0A9D4BY52_DREPO|nr:hypothetical protein DPMN_072932 [Dreissena polymorpha]